MKILFLEEKQSDIKLYESILQDASVEFEARSAKTENEFIKHVNHFQPDLILSGYSLSKYSVNEALTYLKEQSLLIPFVFITGSISEEMARTYVKKGVDDYVPKSNLLHLPVVIKNAIEKKAAEKLSCEAELMRKISEGKLHVIFDNDPDCMFEIGFHGELLKMNPAAIRLTELGSQAKVKKTKIWSFVDKKYLKKFRSYHESVCRGNKNEFTLKFISVKGTIHFLETIAIPLFNSENHVISYLLIGKNMTEKIKAERELQVSQSNFNALIENIAHGVWSIDREYRLISFNKFFRDTVKNAIGMEFQIGDKFDKFIPENILDEFRKKWLTYYDRAFNGEQFSFDTTSVILKEKRYYQISLNPIRSNNEITGVSCVSVEITQIKETLGQLQESEERFRNLSENSPLGIYLTDENGNCIYVNKTWCLLTGYTSDEALGQGWKKALHPDDRERIFKQWCDTAQKTQMFHAEYRFLSKDGKIIWVSGNAVTNKNTDGKSTGYIGTIEDITEIKEKETKRLEAEKNFSQIFDNSPDAIYIEDEKGTILDANEQACKFQGMPKEELIGMNILNIAPIEKGKEIKENYSKLFNEEISRVKSNAWNKDGTEIPIEIHSRRIIFDSKPALLLQVREILSQ